MLTTLHTRDAVQALLRLAETGGNAYSVTESLSLSPELSRALLAGAPAEELAKIWRSGGGQSWLQDGLARAAQGETSPEELLRAAGLGF